MGLELNIIIRVTHKETIKPSSPTPHHLKTLNLSVFYPLSPDVYVPFLLFYPTDATADNIYQYGSLVAEKSKSLKTLLSETLTHYYPFAGKYEYNHSICCNDNGAVFLGAQVNCLVSKILEKPDLCILQQLLPTDVSSTQADTGYLLLVQANFFQCGGIAVGVSLSHKVADASTLSTFIKSWTTIALGSPFGTDHVGILGTSASLFPTLDFLNMLQPAVEFAQEKCTTRKFVFDDKKIAALKCKAASVNAPNPTRVQVVSTLIWKCATSRSSNLRPPPEWFQLVNMRRILGEPSTENLLGNLVGVFAAKAKASGVVDDRDVQSLVAEIRRAIEEFKLKYGDGVSGNDVFEFFKEYWNLMARNDVETYSCSSWCKLLFYETDFGWGKPSWVSQGMEFKNLTVLMDTRDGDGIEASLTLKEEDMALFESNKELLEYASFNPTVII